MDLTSFCWTGGVLRANDVLVSRSRGHCDCGELNVSGIFAGSPSLEALAHGHESVLTGDGDRHTHSPVGISVRRLGMVCQVVVVFVVSVARGATAFPLTISCVPSACRSVQSKR